MSKTALGKFRQAVLQIPLWLYLIVSVYPLFWMVSYSLKNNDEIFVTNPFGLPMHFRYENYINAWTQFNVPRYFLNSLVVSMISTLFILLLALMFAFAVARMRWRFRSAVRTYMIIGMFMPLQVIMIPLVPFWFAIFTLRIRMELLFFPISQLDYLSRQWFS